MEAILQVRLLGGFNVRWCGSLLTGFGAPRLQALLGYILLHRQAPLERSQVAFSLWPDSTEAQAQTNLRRELHNLRAALPEEDRFLAGIGRTLQWRAEAPAQVDLIDFETFMGAASVAEARGETISVRRSLEQAMAAICFRRDTKISCSPSVSAFGRNISARSNNSQSFVQPSGTTPAPSGGWRRFCGLIRCGNRLVAD